MKLHIFNPEHDIALAADMERFTAPHAGRQMRESLGFLPAFWANDGDMVLVDDVEAAHESVRHLKAYAHNVTFVSKDMLQDIKVLNKSGDSDTNTNDGDSTHYPSDTGDTSYIDSIEPWGWDKTLRFQLAKANPALAQLMPDAATLAFMRTLSSRRFAGSQLLPWLVQLDSRLVGESRYCKCLDDVADAIKANECYGTKANGKSVIKAPWSCSGRGVRYVSGTLGQHEEGWVANIIRQQGGVTVEPLYQKVLDFGMEFYADRTPDGGNRVRYCGLSLFDTSNGAYSGSILATESDKREMLSRYVDLALADRVRDAIAGRLQTLFDGKYTGAFGIDMMAVADAQADGFRLHPCVELNLRRTMGHVALALSPDEYEPRRVMRIFYNAGKYKMRVSTTGENLLNTGLV